MVSVPAQPDGEAMARICELEGQFNETAWSYRLHCL
jgi:hypothetical protein